MVNVAERVREKGGKKLERERRGEDGVGIEVEGRGRGVGEGHVVGDEFMLEHRGCYQKLNVMR